MFSNICGYVVSAASAAFMAGMAVYVGIEAKRSYENYKEEKEDRKALAKCRQELAAGGDD